MLEAENINYCHWKSTTALDRSARGDSDLDLLVSRSAAQPFTEVLYRLGFKEVLAPLEQRLPGVLDYYGHDEAANKLIHVHAHYQLVLGDDMTKNYRLPIENVYLASARQGELFRVPAPEFEFFVLVVRLVLKHATWDAVLTRQDELPHSARQEFADLQGRVSNTNLCETLKHTLPHLDAALFDSCVRALQPGCSPWTRLKIGQRLQRTLQAYARRPWAADICLKVWRRAARRVCRRIFGLPRKRFTGGGSLVALVGGDGAGKSTAVDDLHAWLTKDFDAVKVHLGKPPWSLTTRVVRGALKLAGLFNLFFNSSAQVTPSGNRLAFLERAQLLRNTCASRDRYWAYVRARRAATEGSIVICDRFPLSQITLMDAPQRSQEANLHRAGLLIRRLLQLEERWYAAMLPPEVLVVLKVDPEVAVQRALKRSADEDAASVRARSKEIWEQDWRGTRAHIVDASPPRAEVIAQIRSLVWSQL